MTQKRRQKQTARARRAKARGYYSSNDAAGRWLASREAHPSRPTLDDCPVIYTNPGCDHPLHRLEVMGAAEAFARGHRWTGPTLMDCGCLLSLEPLAEWTGPSPEA